jgi:hypothetical protein
MVSCDIATAGAVMPNVPPMIAKAATTAAAMNVVFNNDGKNTIDLNDIREYSVISFATRCVGNQSTQAMMLILETLRQSVATLL